MEGNQNCSSLVSPVMRMHSHDRCIAVAVCGCITFQSVHVAIENANVSHRHGKSEVGKSVIPGHGAGSPATLKGI